MQNMKEGANLSKIAYSLLKNLKKLVNWQLFENDIEK